MRYVILPALRFQGGRDGFDGFIPLRRLSSSIPEDHVLMNASPSTSPQLLSVDLGRTATKACASLRQDDVVVIPSNVQPLSAKEVRGGFEDDDGSDPLLDLWLEYQSQGYAIGQLAADFGANLGLGQTKVEHALVKVLACAGYYRLHESNLAVVLGVPFMTQDHFDREKTELTTQLQGTHTMHFRGDTVQVTIDQVWVLPEGYGSLILCETQNNEAGGEFSFTQSSVAVMDIGYQTTDFLLFDRFRFARGASSSEEFAMAQFYDRVAEQIPGADSQSHTLIEAVNQPEGQRLYRARGQSLATDLDRFLPEIRQVFARELYDQLIRWLPERAHTIIVTGGGGEFFWNDLRLLLRTSQLRPYIASPSRQANALGQYIYGEARLKQSMR